MKSFFEFYHKLNEEFPLDQVDMNVMQRMAPWVKDKKTGAMNQKSDAPLAYQGFMKYQQLQRDQGRGMGAMQDPDFQANKEKLQNMLGQQYETFARMLQQNLTDPKFVRFIQMGIQDGAKEDDLINFNEGFATCSKLTPTQNEIDIDKSLIFPLKNDKNPQSILAMLNGGQFAPGGPIVTCCNKQYVIDGHHRWSQLYCMNPSNQIAVVNMNSPKFKPNPEGAVAALKASLTASVAMGTYSQQTVNSANLMTMPESAVKQWVTTMSEAAKQAFMMFMQQPAAQQFLSQQNPQDPIGLAQNWIWNNVSMMQTNNPPISGASPRSFMPQTGDAVYKFMAPLQQGKINWNPDA